MLEHNSRAEKGNHKNYSHKGNENLFARVAFCGLLSSRCRCGSPVRLLIVLLRRGGALGLSVVSLLVGVVLPLTVRVGITALRSAVRVLLLRTVARGAVVLTGISLLWGNILTVLRTVAACGRAVLRLRGLCGLRSLPAVFLCLRSIGVDRRLSLR